MNRVLVILDPQALEDSIDLLGVADELYGPSGCELYALMPDAQGPPDDAASTGADGDSDHSRLPDDYALAEGVFDVVFRVASLAAHDAAAVAGTVATLHAEYAFALILVPATVFGRMIAPRVAMRLKTGLVADVTAVRRAEGGAIEMIRPAFSGRILATVLNRGAGPVMMSVRPGPFRRAAGGEAIATTATSATTTATAAGASTASPPRRNTVYRSFPAGGAAADVPAVRLLERRERPERADIRESRVLISGGGGVQRHFDRLEDLARELGGMVAASRKVVDSGKAPRAIQVGQSGKMVSPHLYIAVGISGSIQHVVGLKSAEHIIAVNLNRHAPICSLADIVVEGDGREFIERMSERLRRHVESHPAQESPRSDGGTG